MINFPVQGIYWGEKVRVCFDYDTQAVRDDTEEPGLMIIKLDNGHHVLNTECQWQPVGGTVDVKQ